MKNQYPFLKNSFKNKNKTNCKTLSIKCIHVLKIINDDVSFIIIIIYYYKEIICLNLFSSITCYFVKTRNISIN